MSAEHAISNPPATPGAAAAGLTAKDLCTMLGEKFHRIQYASDFYNIPARRKIGSVRLWAAEDVATFKRALESMNARAGGR